MEPKKLLQTWNACLSNNRKAQSELYTVFAGKMYGLCLRYAEDAEIAQDILQNGFIKVFQKASSFEGKGSLEGWIRKIIVNTAIEHYRKNKSIWQSTESLSDQTQEVGFENNLEQLDYQDLMNLIQELPIGYKTVFNLYAIEGYNHKEIADMLDISEGNSKSQLSRARQWLKERLLKMEEITNERTRF